MKFVLIALITNTMLGTYPTEQSCKNAIRSMYDRRVDPLRVMDNDIRRQVVDLNMKYSAPKEYICIQK